MCLAVFKTVVWGLYLTDGFDSHVPPPRRSIAPVHMSRGFSLNCLLFVEFVVPLRAKNYFLFSKTNYYKKSKISTIMLMKMLMKLSYKQVSSLFGLVEACFIDTIMYPGIKTA